MNKDKFYREKINKALLGIPLGLAILVMLLNDHIFKGSNLFPALITGKLSDFAFLFFAPIVLAYLIRAKSFYKIIIAYLAPILFFITINISYNISNFIQNIFSKYLFNIQLWPDISDLIALAIIPASIFYLFSSKKKSRPIKNRRKFEYALVILTLITCLATSRRRPPTHEPVYLEWEKMRAAVKIEKPRPILVRGKIYVKRNYLFINEPNEGIHVIDNSNKKRPIAKLFIKIPGNVDIAIKNSILYADSFTDLLLFQLTLFPEDLYLIKRVEDAFKYDPYQIARPEGYFIPSGVDNDKGVVVGWKPIWAGERQ